MTAYLENEKLIITGQLEFYKEILDTIKASVVILEIDENGNTLPVWMNQRYSEILGYSFQERQSIGTNYKNDELFHPEEIELIRKRIIDVLNNKSDEVAGMCRIKSKNGDWKWLLVSTTKFNYTNHNNLLLGVMLDVSNKITEDQIINEEYIKEIKRLKNELEIGKLTKIEKEIINRLVQGRCTREIAIERNRSYETINNHKRNIFKKLKIKKLSELVGFAIENGLN